MDREPWVTEESVAGGKVRYWPLNRHGGGARGVKWSTPVCECTVSIGVKYVKLWVAQGSRGRKWGACVGTSGLLCKVRWSFLLAEVQRAKPSCQVTWNKIPPNDNIQFQLCQHVLSAPVQSPSKTKGEGAWRGNSSFLLLWHVVTWTPWKTSAVILAWGPLYSTGRGSGGHDLYAGTWHAVLKLDWISLLAKLLMALCVDTLGRLNTD